MIDKRYQNRNYGRRAIELLIAHVKSYPNALEFFTRVVPGDHCPQGSYERLGFTMTGEWHNGEAVMGIRLDWIMDHIECPMKITQFIGFRNNM